MSKNVVELIIRTFKEYFQRSTLMLISFTGIRRVDVGIGWSEPRTSLEKLKLAKLNSSWSRGCGFDCSNGAFTLSLISGVSFTKVSQEIYLKRIPARQAQMNAEVVKETFKLRLKGMRWHELQFLSKAVSSIGVSWSNRRSTKTISCTFFRPRVCTPYAVAVASQTSSVLSTTTTMMTTTTTTTTMIHWTFNRRTVQQKNSRKKNRKKDDASIFARCRASGRNQLSEAILCTSVEWIQPGK